MSPLYNPSGGAAVIYRSTTAPSDTTSQWYDTTYGILKVYNGFDWVPGVDHILDRAKFMGGSFPVPTTAVQLLAAVPVTGLTITPVCPPGPVKLKAQVVMNHGATGWSAGRSMGAFIGDATVSSAPPVALPALASTNSQVTGSTGVFTVETTVQIPSSDVGQRTYTLFAYINNAALTGAFVYGDTTVESFIEAVLDV